MRNIALVCDCIERFWFFRRFYTSQPDYSLTLITNDFVVRLLCAWHKIPCIQLSQNMPTPEYAQYADSVANSSEITVGGYQQDFACKVYSSYLGQVPNRLAQFDVFLIWNGQQLLDKSIIDVFPDKCVYMELSNLPNKIFVDKLGVNAMSSLFFHPDVLDKEEPVEDEFHHQWVGEYEQYKMAPPPQSKVSKFQLYCRAINMLVTSCSSIAGIKNLRYRMKKITPEPVDFSQFHLKNADLDAAFVFCPLQVSSDTQLLIHSDFNNKDIIREAMTIAQNKGLALYVKFHPAERNLAEVKEIVEMSQAQGFTLVANNTNDLLRQCREVVVNNSTVGLEAMIYGKPTHVFGRALYKSFDNERLKKYIHRYLVSGIDYFADHPVDIVSILNQVEGK